MVMMTVLPVALAAWSEAPRVRALNYREPPPSAAYVLCWLQQALRGFDNPVIDAAILLGNSLGLPALVYHGVREDYPFASNRLHSFILGASRDLEQDCAKRGLACVQFVDRPAKRARGLVYQLAANAAAVVLEDQPAFVAQWQSERFASRTSVPVFAVNAACLVPPAALDEGIGTTSAFRRHHEKVRPEWYAWGDMKSDVRAYSGRLPFEPDRIAGMDDGGLTALTAQCSIDHDLPVAAMFPPSRAEVAKRLDRLQAEVLPAEAGWATACYLNDRLSLDGRDPSTYGNLAWAFGDAAPGYGRKPIYGLVSTRTDSTIRKRTGDDWITRGAERRPVALAVPERPPVDPYLTGDPPI